MDIYSEQTIPMKQGKAIAVAFGSLFSLTSFATRTSRARSREPAGAQTRPDKKDNPWVGYLFFLAEEGRFELPHQISPV